MKKSVAYLIDKASVGGGGEYVRRQMRIHPENRAAVFAAANRECTVAHVDRWGADEIVVNHLRALLQLLGNPFRRPHGKVTFVVHGLHLRKYDFLPKTLMNRLRRELRRRLEKWLYHRCDRIVALTSTDAGDIRRCYGEDLDVSVEPNTNDGLVLREPSGLAYGQDEFAFVCIARCDFPKGQDVLLQAIAQRQDEFRRRHQRLLLIGGADVPADIADLVENAGEIPDAGVYMTCGRVLVAPSRWEGMPYLLLEAVARERTVIATDCPGNRDALAGYGKVRFVPVENAVALAEEMIREGQPEEETGQISPN